MYESMIAGPAYSDAAEPVSTKIPAPMIAPMPSVTRFTGPSARFRLCSPVSDASFIKVSSDLVANKGLPMQLLLCGCRLAATLDAKLDFAIVGAHPVSPYNKFLCRAAGFRAGARPQQIHRHAEHHNHQSRPRGLGFIEQQHQHNDAGSKNIKHRHDRIAECFVWPLHIGPLGAQYKYSGNRQ